MIDSSAGRAAIISVSDKARVKELARFLSEHGFQILATHNTYKALEAAGISATEVSDYTGYPEVMDGRVKTLHPKVFAGILSNRASHEAESRKLGLLNIDLVVANLYPFQHCVELEDVDDSLKVERIDVGGVTLLRAGAKNFQHVAVVSDVCDYDALMQEISENKGATTLEYRRRMAAKAFAAVASYDACIHAWLQRQDGDLMPQEMIIHGRKVQDLRIGENPHQKAALYSIYKNGLPAGLPVEQLHGKELSFNNVVDIESASKIVAEFDVPAVSVIKHGNPCGAAISTEIGCAYEKAITCDPKSSFGAVIALNRQVTAEVAQKVVGVFVEAVVAPDFAEDALEILRTKKNLRIMKCELNTVGRLVFKSTLSSGLLVQERDSSSVGINGFLRVTTMEASPEALSDLLFAWRICKHVKSNAIVIARNGRAVGVGAGQMSRVDSVEIAVRKAQDCAGTVMASDAFFPFADSVQHAVAAGISAIVQPGGSLRDKEVIETANNSHIAMYFTGFRNFCH
ncbi:MAG: bifunctional phosphoribosylaminoimidazolecarboxamide formyltransferase/IMP cyclohydrolase [Anaplasma sp.]